MIVAGAIGICGTFYNIDYQIEQLNHIYQQADPKVHEHTRIHRQMAQLKGNLDSKFEKYYPTQIRDWKELAQSLEYTAQRVREYASLEEQASRLSITPELRAYWDKTASLDLFIYHVTVAALSALSVAGGLLLSSRRKRVPAAKPKPTPLSL